MKHLSWGKVALDTRPELEASLDTIFFSIVAERRVPHGQLLLENVFDGSMEVPEDYEDGEHVVLKWSQKTILTGLARDLTSDRTGIEEAVFEHSLHLQRNESGLFAVTDRRITNAREVIAEEVDSRLGNISMLLVVLDPRSASYPEAPNPA